MSDVQAPQGGDATDTVLPRDAVAAGQRLKQAREAAGLHVVALAAALKVPVKKLEALEAGRTGDLPDATFARALAASVCRQLKIDPTDVLAQLPQAGGSRLGEDPVLNTPFRTPRDPAGATRAPQGVPKAVWIALVILLSAAAVWWWVPPASDDTPLALPAEPLLPVAPTEGATSMGAGANVAEETAAPPSDAPAAAVAANTPAAPMPTGAEGVPAAVPTTAQPAPAPAAPTVPASGVLVIRAQADSWIEVSSGGKVLVQRLIKAGDSVALADPTPLSVVIGRADATEVLVHGKPFDLAAVARNNVARFEVK
ncbi:helix-turn-helix domain-containing protein [Hydrogenophaga atypica]|uniref:Helix-turn-helix domain-containing protein n=1 Tax=Hydrogenophaga atypica TaxID=249409 RepID=A0ABW2QHB4_9BURK